MNKLDTRKISQKDKKLPSALDWANLVAQLPEEKVEIDKNGHYDPKKSPDFYDWMING